MAIPLFPFTAGIQWSRDLYPTAGKTMIQTGETGKEVRIGTMVRPRWNYKLKVSMRAWGSSGDTFGQYTNANQVPAGDRLTNTNGLTDNEFGLLQGFIIGLRGSLGEFLWDDPADNTVGLYRYAIAGGTQTTWQTPFTYTPTLSWDQAWLNANRIENSYTSPWAGATINATGLVTSGAGPPIVGTLLYVTTRLAGATPYLGQQFATADGASTVYQLTRTIGGTATGFPEPIQNINNPASVQIWINGALTTAYTIGATGQVTFTTAPAAGAILSWSGKFYQRLRMKTDEQKATEILSRMWEGDVEAISVLL